MKVRTRGKILNLESTRRECDALLRIGFRILIAKRKARVLVLPPSEASRGAKRVELSDGEVEYLVGLAVIEAIREHIARCDKAKKGKGLR